MPVNLNQYRETVCTSNNRYLNRFKNSHQHFKYYLNDIDIAFGVLPFSCSVLTTMPIFFLSLKIHWRLSMVLKTSKKEHETWSNVFWYVKVCKFGKFIQYTIHWVITQMLKKFPLDKINGTKNVSLKVCVEFFIFESVSFLLKFIFFFQQKVRTPLWLWNVIIPLKIKIIESHTQFCSQTSGF